eukprot:scaffold38_cov113-Skeletonema_dohrnii-CCMP3373.AAC.1
MATINFDAALDEYDKSSFQSTDDIDNVCALYIHTLKSSLTPKLTVHVKEPKTFPSKTKLWITEMVLLIPTNRIKCPIVDTIAPTEALHSSTAPLVSMKTRNDGRAAAAAARRLFFSSAVGSFACICSDTSVSAFQTTTSGLASLGTPSSYYSERKLIATKEQSRDNKFRLFVTNYSHEEEQEYQINEGEETYFEHQYGWDNYDDTPWFPLTDS